MKKIHASLEAIMTCPAGHDHGPGVVRFTYDGDVNPFAVAIEVESEVVYSALPNPTEGVAERETLARCAAYGDLDRTKIYGTPGAVTFKIRRRDPDVMTIAVPTTLYVSSGRVSLMCSVERAGVTEFISRVYDAVPDGAEQLDLDRLSARLLYS